MSVGYAPDGLDDGAAAGLRRRSRGRDTTALIPVGPKALRSCIEAFIDVGFSKFVVRPMAVSSTWRAELESIADAAGDLQS